MALKTYGSASGAAIVRYSPLEQKAIQDILAAIASSEKALGYVNDLLSASGAAGGVINTLPVRNAAQKLAQAYQLLREASIQARAMVG